METGPVRDQNIVIIITTACDNRYSAFPRIVAESHFTSAGRFPGAPDSGRLPGQGGPVSKPGRSSHVVLCIGSEALSLYHRCAFLREQGWGVLSSTSGHEGILRFTAEPVDAVVVDLNGDGAEGALIAAELKRVRPRVPVIILVVEGETLVDGALDSADAVVHRSDHSKLLKTLPASRAAASGANDPPAV
jgi:hypothetical protein